ncbi:MAG: MBL fold metallo-hydrolase [Dehalococcoidales bacterium]|nr:MBL fold metallo-hydrolase [Dehalococcoidales bacterium]
MNLNNNVHILKMALPQNALVPDSTLGYTLVYLIRFESGWGLIDTGWDDETTFTSFSEQLENLGIRMTDIKWILLTHSHADHQGLARAIKETTKANIIMHTNETPEAYEKRVKEVERSSSGDLSTLLLLHGMPHNEITEISSRSHPPRNFISSFKVDKFIKGDDVSSLSPLKIIWTPGHSPGHLCLYEPREKLLFSGDHVLPTITSNISISILGEDNPLRDYMDSLSRIEDLEVNQILPGHEGPFVNPKRRINELRAHHFERLKSIRIKLMSGPNTAYEIAESIKWAPGEWGKMTPLNKLMGLMETLAHLRYLVREGVVVEIVGGDSSLRYRLSPLV